MKYKLECHTENQIPFIFEYDNYVELKRNYENLSLPVASKKIFIEFPADSNIYIEQHLEEIKENLTLDFISTIASDRFLKYCSENKNCSVDDYLFRIDHGRWIEYLRTH